MKIPTRAIVQRLAKWISFGLSWLFLVHAVPVHGQVPVPGKGFFLDGAGSFTSTPSEVISGRYSIKGSYFGTASFTAYLYTDPQIIKLTANQTYRITFSYRIITPSSVGFEFGFSSATASGAGRFLRTNVVTGAAGSSGTGTITSTLESYTDYVGGFKIAGTGAIAIDDIQISDVSTGQIVVSENAEGPTIKPGPLNFQITDGITLVTAGESTVRSSAARDLDGDGYPEVILTLTAPGTSTLPLQPLIINARSRLSLATTDFFPSGAPTVKHSPVTLFADINGDALQDILFADAGSDAPPWTGSRIGVGLNLGGGKYRDVSSLVPADLQTTRSYSLAAGNIDEDARVEIILPDQSDGSNTALLRWNGNGFDAQRNWIPPTLWRYPTNLNQQSWLLINDLDKDGRQDLLVGSMSRQPNLRIVFGSADGFTLAGLLDLPDGLFGHAPSSTLPVTEGADVGPIVVTDFNNDGLPDIFATEEQVLRYQPGVFTDTNEPDYINIRANGGIVYADVGFQVFINQGSRKFTDVTSGSSVLNLGRRYYQNLVPIDMNNDGFMDVVGTYQTKFYAGVRVSWGTTLFLNDGTGAFQVVNGTEVLPAVTATPSQTGQQWNLGSFVPTLVNREKTEGVVWESVGGCGGPGFCTAPRVQLYKVVANGSIGTGPGFQESAKLGVPGFNEFYYLRQHPDAAGAVRSGQYATGLAHYLAVGRAAGYSVSAPNAKNPGFPFSLVDRGSVSRTGTESSGIIQTGYATVRADQGSSTPAGVAIYGYRPGNYLVSETAVPATLAARSGRLYAEMNAVVSTGIAIANPSTQPATIDFYYTDSAGADAGSGSIILAPNTQFAKFIDQAPLKRFSASTFEGTFSYSSNVPVAAMAIRGFLNERGDFLTSTLPVVDLSSSPQAGALVVPHFADGGGWTTEILLVNPGNVSVNGTVEFRNAAGALTAVPLTNQATPEYLIPPRSSRKLTTIGAGPTTTGTVRIIPAGGSAAPSALIVFSYKSGNVTVSQAGVTSVRGTALRMYAESAGILFGSGNIQSGLAVANNSSAEITVTFELYNRDGSTTGLPTPASKTVGPFGQIAVFLSDIFPGTLPDPFRGVVRISTPSSDGVSAVGLRSRLNEQLDFLITTTPPTDEGAAADSSERIFPQLAVGGGYATEFVLFSGKQGQNSTGTVWLLSGSGGALYVPLR